MLEILISAFTEKVVPAIAEAGADIIELGLPFSDPMADGPTNQAAAERGLASGTTTRGLFESVKRIREESDVPILLYTYLNPILAFGLERFAETAGGQWHRWRPRSRPAAG